jgi:hypothetical protein
VSDIDTVAVDSLKALDPNGPIREADISDAGASMSPLKIIWGGPLFAVCHESFRYSSIARIISFRIFSIVTSSRR